MSSRPFRANHRHQALCFALLCTLGVAPVANAQWMTQDNKSIFQVAKEYALTAKGWIDQYNHYKQQLISAQKLTKFNAANINANDFTERPLSFGMEQRCGHGGGLTSQIKDWATEMVAIKENVIAAQMRICKQTQLLENMKFNETVRILKTLGNSTDVLDQLISTLDRIANGSKSQGELAGAQAQGDQVRDATELEVRNWQTNVSQYDTMIASLNQQQAMLTQIVMKGDKGTGALERLGNSVVKAATLKLALCENTGLIDGLVENPYRKNVSCSL